MPTPNIDRAGMGFPFRPTVSTMAELMWNFDPRTQEADEFDLPATTDFTVVRWNDAADSQARIDFAHTFAGRFRRIWGYAAQMFYFGWHFWFSKYRR